MAAKITYPGVYVEEQSGGVRPIQGVATGTTAVRTTLRRVADQVARTRKARALFVGKAGPGRKRAAEAIAQQLGRNLFAVDLAAVVSAYAGEAEKQIGKLFDRAEAAGAVLFLDEADALFGKRTKVRDSHDRYADRAADVILGRLKSFDGTVIVASRSRTDIDDALLRRLRYVVDLPPKPAGQR